MRCGCWQAAYRRPHRLNLYLPPALSTSRPPACSPAGTVVTGQIDGYLLTLQHYQKYGTFPKPPTTKSSEGVTMVDVFPRVC